MKKQAKKVQSCPPENTLANGLNGDLQTPTSSQESETPESLTRQDGPFSTISIEMADTLSLQVIMLYNLVICWLCDFKQNSTMFNLQSYK